MLAEKYWELGKNTGNFVMLQYYNFNGMNGSVMAHSHISYHMLEIGSGIVTRCYLGLYNNSTWRYVFRNSNLTLSQYGWMQ